jgi:hypothetical protein
MEVKKRPTPAMNYVQILQAIQAAYPNSRPPGCPVANGGSECTRGCGGFNKITGENLFLSVTDGTINTEGLCGPLTGDAVLIQSLLGIASTPQIG